MARDPQKPQFFRTLRVKNVQQVGVLAGVLGVVARHGASVGDIRTVHQSRTSMVRDIDLLVESLAELDAIVAELDEMPETTVLELRDEVLSAHLGGKIRMVPQMPIDTFADLGRVYTPASARCAGASTRTLRLLTTTRLSRIPLPSSATVQP